MIITLLPFLLAAKIDSPAEKIWKHGGEVTYLINSHATTTYPTNYSSHHDMTFDLRTLLTCQAREIKLRCVFHDTEIRANFTNEKLANTAPSNDQIEDNVWAKKMLQLDSITVEFTKTGVKEVLSIVDVDPIGTMMIGALGNLLDIGLDMTKLSGDFQSSGEMEGCNSKFLVLRSAATNNNPGKSMFNLFLIPQPNESLLHPVEIAQSMEKDKCEGTKFMSFFTFLEMKKWREGTTTAKISSAEKFTIISNGNFAVFSKVSTLITNHKTKLKYTLEESSSLTLQRIGPVQCESDDSSSQEDC